MPDEVSLLLDQLAREYATQWELLLDGADYAMTGLWYEAGGITEAAAAAWVDTAGPVIEGVQTAAAELAAGWLDTQAAFLGAAELPPAAATVLEAPTAVLSSPPVRMRSLVAEGMQYADALGNTAGYVRRLASTTARAAEQAGRAQRAAAVADALPDDYYQGAGGKLKRRRRKGPGGLRYTRVPDARACGWCRVVADRLYTEAGVAGQWHGFCRCTWRLAVAADAQRLGQLADYQWRDVIDQRAIPTPGPTVDEIVAADIAAVLDAQRTSSLWAEGRVVRLEAGTYGLPDADGVVHSPRELWQHPDLQAMPDDGVAIISGLPGTNSQAPIGGAVVFRHEGVLVVADQGELVARVAADLSPAELLEWGTADLDNLRELYARDLDAISALHAQLPADRRYLQQVTLSREANPADAYWAQRYNMGGFESAATGGGHTVTIYNGRATTESTLRHEYGHLLDDSLKVDGVRFADSSTWATAVEADRVLPDRVPGLGQLVDNDGRVLYATSTQSAVSAYGSKAAAEDYAESVRLFLLDRRDGYLASSDGVRYTFAELYPERAKLLQQQLYG